MKKKSQRIDRNLFYKIKYQLEVGAFHRHILNQFFDCIAISKSDKYNNRTIGTVRMNHQK